MIHLERALYALAALAAASFGLHTLWVLLETGTTPGLSDALDTLPLTLLTSLPLLIVLTVARGNGWSGLAAASIGWATTTRAVTELPSVSSDHDWGDGLFLAPWVLFAGLAVTAFAAGSKASPATRAAVLATASVTANGRLFSRENGAVYALIAAAVLLLLLATARERRRAVGAQRVSVALVASFVIWVVAAAVAGSFPAQGLQIASRVAVGALLAWGLSVGLDSSGRRAVLTTMLLLITVTLGMAVHGLIDTAAVESWPRVLFSRMRVFGLHPNGIGPYLAASACLAAGLALSRQRLALSRQGVVGACCALVAAASSGALVLTESRASTLGLIVGLGAVVVTALVRVPRRALSIAALVTLPFAAVAAAWLGPTGEGLRAKLDLAATGPSAIGQRYHFWRMALAGLEDSPWLGVGPNQYEALARYAQPSYYDGTSQTLHSHNLELGVAAGAGWPALLLLLGLFYVLLNAWRSSSVDDTERASRFEKSAVLGMAVAVLTANQLDLGQAQQTFVPLVLWVAIGFLASYRTSGATVDSRGWIVPAVAVGGLLLVVRPLLAVALLDSASVAIERGDPEGAIARYERSHQLEPGNTEPLTNAARIAAASRRPGLELEFRERMVELTPRRARSWLALARAQVARGRFEAADHSLARALEADPLGSSRGKILELQGYSQLCQGNVDAGRELMVDAIAYQATPWASLPTVLLPPDPESEASPSRRGFESPVGVVSVSELLDLAGERAIRIAVDQPVESRRQLSSIVAGLRWDDAPDHALEFLDRHRAANPDSWVESLVVLRVECLLDLGLLQDAIAEFERVQSFKNPMPLTLGAELARRDGDTDLTLDFAARAQNSLLGIDLFVGAGTTTALRRLQFEIARDGLGEDPLLLAYQRLLRTSDKPAVRLAVSEETWDGFRTVEAEQEEVVRVLSDILADRSRAGRTELPPARQQRADELVVETSRRLGLPVTDFAFAVREAVSGLGWAAEDYVAALERALDG